MAPHHLRETLRQLPRAPGVYIFRSRTGEVIYVGKATSLRDRVRSYFAPGAGDAVPKVRRIAAEADRIEIRETGSELAALLLESRLIKRLAPRYNSQGRGYRSYVFIKVDASDPFPRVWATRRAEPDGALYLGPFASGQTVEAVLDLLHRLFPLRTCDEPIGLFRDRRPCVRGQIGRCGAPCAGLTDVKAYGTVVGEAVRFLRGEPTGLVERLETEMAAAAERLEFERAARLRDDLEAVRAIVERQALLLEALARRSVVAICRGRDPGTAELLVIRHGLLAGEARVAVAGRRPLELIAELAAFLARYWPRPGPHRARPAGPPPTPGTRPFRSGAPDTRLQPGPADSLWLPLGAAEGAPGRPGGLPLLSGVPGEQVARRGAPAVEGMPAAPAGLPAPGEVSTEPEARRGALATRCAHKALLREVAEADAPQLAARVSGAAPGRSGPSGTAAALALTAGSAMTTASMSREELDELLIVARWLRSIGPEGIVDLPEESVDPAAHPRLASELAARVRSLVAPLEVPLAGAVPASAPSMSTQPAGAGPRRRARTRGGA